MDIGTKFTGYTALSSTDPQLLGGAAVELPDDAKEILAVIPFITSPAGNTANEPVAGKMHMICESQKLDPYYVLAQPIGSSLLKSVAQLQGDSKAVMYPVHAKMAGGESIKCYGTGLFNHTIEPYMAALIIYSDIQTGKPQVHAKVGTFTNTGTAAARVTGSGISIVGGKMIIEACALAVGTTVAALKGIAGHVDLYSSGFKKSWTLDIPVNPISGQVDTNIQEAVAGVMRLQQHMGIKNKTTINDAFTLAVAVTTTGNWIAGVLYN